MSQEKKKSIRDAWALYRQNPELNSETLLSCLERYRSDWTEHRRKEQDRSWKQKIMFYQGDHYVRSLSSQSNPYRVRVKENHTNNAINRMLSIFIQNLPITRVFANSVDHEDQADADATEAWLKYVWRKQQLEMQLQKWIKLTLITGNAFLFRGFNPDLGGRVILDAEETPDGKPREAEYRGDVETQVDDPFRIAVRPGIDSWEDHFDFIRSVPSNRAMLEAKHGALDADPAKGLSLASMEAYQDPDVVMVHHYYHKPTAWFPEGLYVSWAGKRILKAREYPEKVQTLPSVHLPFDTVPGKFWGLAPIDQIMDLQEQLDRAASMIVEARNLVARPRVLVSNEAEVPLQSLTDRPGEVIRFKQAGGPPRFETPGFNFTELANHKADLRNALNQVMGITSASRGEIPAAARTALALQLVLEQDRSQFLPFIKRYHAGILAHNYGLCELAAQFFPEEDPRVIKIEGMTQARDFSGALIPDPLDIYLEDSNPLGWTATGRIEQVGFLIDKGIVTDRNQILSMLKLNSPDPGAEVMKINVQAQEKELELLRQGQLVELGPEDDDAVHLDVLNKVIASYSFRSFPKPVQDAILAHNEAHKARFQEATGGGAPAPEQGAGGAPRAGGVSPEQMGAALQAPTPAGVESLLPGQGG